MIDEIQKFLVAESGEIKMEYYAYIALKLFFGLVLVLFFFKYSGAKRQLTQITAIDLITNFMLGAIWGGFVYNNDITIRGFTAIILTYFILIFVINQIINNTIWGRNFLVGSPLVIIADGKLDIKKLKKSKLGMSDLMSLLRKKEIRSLTDVKRAQIEVNGELTVVKKGDENYAILLIDNGNINEQALKQIKKSKKWLDEGLKKHKIKNLEDVFCAQWLNGDFYIIKK